MSITELSVVVNDGSVRAANRGVAVHSDVNGPSSRTAASSSHPLSVPASHSRGEPRLAVVGSQPVALGGVSRSGLPTRQRRERWRDAATATTVDHHRPARVIPITAAPLATADGSKVV